MHRLLMATPDIDIDTDIDPLDERSTPSAVEWRALLPRPRVEVLTGDRTTKHRQNNKRMQMPERTVAGTLLDNPR